MEDERLNPENMDNKFNEDGVSVEDDDIVDGSAEVVEETTSTGSGESPTDYEQDDRASRQYEDYEEDPDDSTYSHADHDSATGNGSYRYENSSHEYYQGDSYGSSMGNGSGSGSGGRGKGFLAVVLAVVFGACVGAGFWGVNRYLGSTEVTAESAITDSADQNESEITGEKKVTEEHKQPSDDAAAQQAGNDAAGQQQAGNDAAAQQTGNDAAAQQQTGNDAAAQQAGNDAAGQQQAGNDAAGQQTGNDAAAQQQAGNDAAAQQQAENTASDNAGTKNEAGLIIADTETPDTELTKVVNKVMPSIVSVYNDFTEEVQTFYGQTYTRQGESTGSGIIIGQTDTELLIVTNNHVVEGADNLRVLFLDQETCDAELKGTNPSNDLAVIAISLDNIKDTTKNVIRVATLGNSDNLKIGEDVIAIGNALGYGQSVTTGIVSAVNREISDETIKNSNSHWILESVNRPDDHKQRLDNEVISSKS